MFTIKQALITIKVVVTLGTTIVVATAASTTPTNAALLNFNFSTANGSTRSFTLDTSIQDSPSSGIDQGFYDNAISNFEYSGLAVSEPLDLEASTPNPGPRTVFFVRGLSENNLLFYLTLNFSNLSLSNNLSDNPADYSPFSLGSDIGSFAGYGGGFELLPGGEELEASLGYFFTPVTSVTVANQAPAGVPEPGTVLGLGLLGMWSLKRILSSLVHA
jgi:hypothetical protein